MKTDEWVHYTVHKALKEERDRLVGALEDIKNTTTEVGTLIKADRAVMDYAEKRGGEMEDRISRLERAEIDLERVESQRDQLREALEQAVTEVEQGYGHLGDVIYREALAVLKAT